MSDVDNKVKMIVEGLLMAAGRPLTLDNIIQVFARGEKPDRKELKAVMEAIAADCDDRGFELKQVASGYRFQVKQDLSEWVAKLWEEKPPRYTAPLLETLALIAYRQPITRGDIEEIRGVAVSPNIVRTLLDREWIRVVGHRDVPGRPALLATTKQFLDYFNLKSLQELPPLSEIKELEPTEPEIDLAEELAKQRVIELPAEEQEEGGDDSASEAEKDQLLAEEEALELSRKPLDEILQIDNKEAANDPQDDVNDVAAVDSTGQEDGPEQNEENSQGEEPAANHVDEEAERVSVDETDEEAAQEVASSPDNSEDTSESGDQEAGNDVDETESDEDGDLSFGADILEFSIDEIDDSTRH